MQEPQAEAHSQALLCSPHWPQMSAHSLAASQERIRPFSPQAPFYGEGTGLRLPGSLRLPAWIVHSSWGFLSSKLSLEVAPP